MLNDFYATIILIILIVLLFLFIICPPKTKQYESFDMLNRRHPDRKFESFDMLNRRHPDRKLEPFNSKRKPQTVKERLKHSFKKNLPEKADPQYD
jgi:hypothetical protein